MSIFTPEQFEQLRLRAVIREAVAGVEITTRATRPSKSDIRRGKRYYRLTRYNGHRFSYRVAYRDDPGNATMEFIAACLSTGTLKMDLSQIRRLSEVDRELQSLLNAGH